MTALALLAATLSIQGGQSAALLICSTDPARPTAQQDGELIRDALIKRGLDLGAITSLSGNLSPSAIQQAFKELGSRTRTWDGGTVLIYLNSSAAQGQGGLTLGSLAVSDLLKELAGSTGTRFGVIADTDYTNLLYGHLPRNVSALSPQGTWRDVTFRRPVGTVVHQGQTMRVGILSYIVAREIPFSADMRELSIRVNKYKESGSMAAIWSDLPSTQVFGDGLWPLPGRTWR